MDAGAIVVTITVKTANMVMIAFFIFLHPFKSCRLKNDGKLLGIFGYLKVVIILRLSYSTMRYRQLAAILSEGKAL